MRMSTSFWSETEREESKSWWSSASKPSFVDCKASKLDFNWFRERSFEERERWSGLN